MNMPQNKCRTAIILAVLFVFALTAAAQPEHNAGSTANYDIVLNLVVGSNEAVAGAELSSELSAVSRQIRTHFPFSNYRLANTFIGRVAENGNFEYKSVAALVGRTLPGDEPTFLDWAMYGLHRQNTNAAKGSFAADAFRFGARVPVRTGVHTVEPGKSASVINYENVGLTFKTMGVPVNTPTLLGTLSLPDTSGTLFLIMTVRDSAF